MTAFDLVSAVADRVASALGSVYKTLLQSIPPSALQLLQHYIQTVVHLVPNSRAVQISQLAMLKFGEVLSQNAFPLRILAIALLVLTAPLIADLTVSALGNLRRFRVKREEMQDVRLAVVVPAHNQEPLIARTLQALETAGCSLYVSSAADNSTSQLWEVQVFVVAHNCSDSTAAVAVGCGARVVALSNDAERSKGAALRLGFETARSAGANAFLLVDVDSLVAPNLIAATRAALVGGAAATQCRVAVESTSTGPTTFKQRLHAIAFRAKNVVRARGHAGFGFSSCVIGNGFAVTDEALNRAPFVGDELYGNLEYHARIVSAGLRVHWVDHTSVSAPLASIRSAEARLSERLRVVGRETTPLLLALLRGRWRAIAVLAEAWSLPVIAAVFTLLAVSLVPLHAARVFSVSLAAIVFLYAIQTLLLGPEPWRDLVAPFSAAAQSIRKLFVFPRKNALLERSRREAPHS